MCYYVSIRHLRCPRVNLFKGERDEEFPEKPRGDRERPGDHRRGDYRSRVVPARWHRDTGLRATTDRDGTGRSRCSATGPPRTGPPRITTGGEGTTKDGSRRSQFFGRARVIEIPPPLLGAEAGVQPPAQGVFPLRFTRRGCGGCRSEPLWNLDGGLPVCPGGSISRPHGGGHPPGGQGVWLPPQLTPPTP